jgi:hypothetical protein
MLATTQTGQLNNIDDCYIKVGSLQPIYMYIMPDIGDGHAATYAQQNGIGRSMPAYTFSYGGPRQISWTIHLYADTYQRLLTNLQTLRIIESCTYPRNGAGNLPFVPPSICKLKCGPMLGDYEINVVLMSYSVKYPVDVQWSDKIGIPYNGNIISVGPIPYKFDIDCTFEVVYDASQLPGSERILSLGN